MPKHGRKKVPIRLGLVGVVLGEATFYNVNGRITGDFEINPEAWAKAFGDEKMPGGMSVWRGEA